MTVARKLSHLVVLAVSLVLAQGAEAADRKKVQTIKDLQSKPVEVRKDNKVSATSTKAMENYKRFLGFGLLGFDPLYPTILLRSVLLGAATAFICAVLALPLAFFIARLPACSKSFALVLVVIPFWTNLLIRTYAWQILLAPDSWLSAAARALGILGANQGVYPGMAAVLVGMVCDFLPFLVLDMVVANVLLALGMQTLSPSQVSLPFKILLFVAVDGWSLLARGLILGYR